MSGNKVPEHLTRRYRKYQQGIIKKYSFKEPIISTVIYRRPPIGKGKSPPIQQKPVRIQKIIKRVVPIKGHTAPPVLISKTKPIKKQQKINPKALEIREGYKHLAEKELKYQFPNGLKKSHSRADQLRYYFLLYGSDKFQQHYHLSYAKYLPESVGNFLEIGTWQGGGILAFKKWYNNHGSFFTLNHVFGIDGIITIRAMNNKGINCFEGSQSDINFLRTIKDKFDVITEDGSHHSDEQITTFKHMFKHNLKKGGLYIIEDMYCCNESYWWRRIIKSFDDTMLGVVRKVLKGGSWKSQMFTKRESDYFKKTINKIILASGTSKDSILYIWKN